MKRIAASLTVFSGLWLFWLGAFNFGVAEETRLPTIDVQEASRIVLQQFPNAQIKEIELDTEDGRLVYEVELITADRRKKELHVNARTGQIEKIEHD